GPEPQIPMILKDKRVLVTGVLNEASIAFGVARLAQEQGAEVILSSFGRVLRLTERTAKRLPQPARVVELDVTNQEHLDGLAQQIGGELHGVLHAVAYAPESAMGGNFLATPWDDVGTALHISAFSLKSLAVATAPILGPGSGIVGLDFDASVAWPVYDWMGVAKAALESTARYLARDLGPQKIRVNLVSAGPLRTMAAKSIPGFQQFASWPERSPLGWDLTDTEPAARACVALLSDWFPATTGEIIHVDGGFHAVGN
ncbi:MAG TPA: enoyl-ACP reductase FabI, partial [Longimicrobiales bacterium]|nr:enoyl-ACP reductase FabI [Longimicrobiales bacterium]